MRERIARFFVIIATINLLIAAAFDEVTAIDLFEMVETRIRDKLDELDARHEPT